MDRGVIAITRLGHQFPLHRTSTMALTAITNPQDSRHGWADRFLALVRGQEHAPYRRGFR
jgi:hypothetical protein